MKKITTYLLLFAFLYNICGQLIVHQYLVYRSDRFFERQTEKGLYNVNDLTEVRIPSEMSNITDWANYVSISGQVQFDNASYNYVKMKITRHAIYLMCVPDYATTRLNAQNIIIAKSIWETPLSKKEHVPYGKTVLLVNFSISFARFTFDAPFKNAEKVLIEPICRLNHYAADVPEQPPKSFC